MTVAPPGEAKSSIASATSTEVSPADAPVPVARSWTKMLLALAAFVILPGQIPIVPFERTMVLFVPALAACTLVGWWAGGRATLAILWVAAATFVAVWPPAAMGAFENLGRGWALLLAGAFGMVCLLSDRRPFFSRGLVAVGLTLGLAFVMGLGGSVSLAQASSAVGSEFAKRNGETMALFNDMITKHPDQWKQLAATMPSIGDARSTVQTMLDEFSAAGVAAFPALLALESLAALALAWAAYHRLARIRLGSPLAPLREFRFSDQLIWGLIVGLVILLLPTLSTWRGAGLNLVVFFGVLYLIRGLGVLAWFMAPRAFNIMLIVGFAMLCLPPLNVVAAMGLLVLSVAAVGLGLADTWADWRSRAVPTPTATR